MGTDTIAKAADSFERKQRRSLEQLEQPNLFTHSPRVTCRVIATPVAGHVPILENVYRLVMEDEAVIVVDGITRVGRIDEPPASLVHSMRGPTPAACGRVIGVSTLSGKLELEVS